MVDDNHTYMFKISGAVNRDDINAASPVTLSVEGAGESVTFLSACTDQSGLIGLIRHLHSMGLYILSVQVIEML